MPRAVGRCLLTVICSSVVPYSPPQLVSTICVSLIHLSVVCSIPHLASHISINHFLALWRCVSHKPCQHAHGAHLSCEFRCCFPTTVNYTHSLRIRCVHIAQHVYCTPSIHNWSYLHFHWIVCFFLFVKFWFARVFVAPQRVLRPMDLCNAFSYGALTIVITIRQTHINAKQLGPCAPNPVPMNTYSSTCQQMWLWIFLRFFECGGKFTGLLCAVILISICHRYGNHGALSIQFVVSGRHKFSVRSSRGIINLFSFINEASEL